MLHCSSILHHPPRWPPRGDDGYADLGLASKGLGEKPTYHDISLQKGDSPIWRIKHPSDPQNRLAGSQLCWAIRFSSFALNLGHPLEDGGPCNLL